MLQIAKMVHSLTRRPHLFSFVLVFLSVKSSCKAANWEQSLDSRWAVCHWCHQPRTKTVNSNLKVTGLGLNLLHGWTMYSQAMVNKKCYKYCCKDNTVHSYYGMFNLKKLN